VIKNILLVYSHINIFNYSYIQRVANEVVEEITEIPTTPPPRVQERTVTEPAGPAQVIKRVIRVPSRSGGYGGYQQQQGASFVSNVGQASSNLLNARSYGIVPQAYGGYQQQQGASFVSNVGQASSNLLSARSYGTVPQAYGGYQQYGGYGSVFGGYGPVGGGFQQQGFSYGGYPSQAAGSFGSFSNANCFYV
jgi:hypothetical protein